MLAACVFFAADDLRGYDFLRSDVGLDAVQRIAAKPCVEMQRLDDEIESFAQRDSQVPWRRRIYSNQESALKIACVAIRKALHKWTAPICK